MGYKVIFVNNPPNVKKLRNCVPPNSSIRFLEIPFTGSNHGLPPETENTDGLVSRFLQASLCLQPSFRKLLSDVIRDHGGEKPLCVVADLFFGWSAGVAREFGVFHVIFVGGVGFGCSCYYSTWFNLPHRRTNSSEFTLPDFPEAGCFHTTQLSRAYLEADGTDPVSVFQQKNLLNWLNSDGFLFNTVEELDNIGLSYFRRKLSRPVWPIGPILLSVDERAGAGQVPGLTPQHCIQWLDAKQPKSVLYISFWSQNTISASQMMQLAKALASTGKSFIRVIRPPLGFDSEAEFKPQEWLPEGFIDGIEVKTQGLILQNWAPQLEILAHRSTGGFWSHCGWNSVLESLSQGVPLIGWPMAGEQYFNAHFLQVRIRVCVEMGRGTSFEVRHEDIMEKIEMVMGENERGERMRREALKVKEMLKNAVKDEGEEEGFKGSSVKASDDFLDSAMLLTKGLTKEGQNS